MAKIIFITGASRGFGKLWAEAFLERGDKVVATARDLSSLDGLAQKYGENILPLQLDVNDREADFADTSFNCPVYWVLLLHRFLAYILPQNSPLRV